MYVYKYLSTKLLSSLTSEWIPKFRDMLAIKYPHKHMFHWSTKFPTWPAKLLIYIYKTSKKYTTLEKMGTKLKPEQNFANFRQLVDRINLKYKDWKPSIAGRPSSIPNGLEFTYIEKIGPAGKE